MTPPAAATRTAGAPAPRQTPQHRQPLRLVDRHPRRRRHLARRLAVALVLASLLAVVAGHEVLAEEQVRLSAAESQLSTAQSGYRQDVLGLAEREAPSRIVDQAEKLQMVAPTQITQLPYVSLTTPLATPDVAPASGSAGSSTTASSSGATGSPGT